MATVQAAPAYPLFTCAGQPVLLGHLGHPRQSIAQAAGLSLRRSVTSARPGEHVIHTQPGAHNWRYAPVGDLKTGHRSAPTIYRTSTAPARVVASPSPHVASAFAAWPSPEATLAEEAYDRADEATAASQVDGLVDFLREVGLVGRAAAVQAWCERSGAAFVDEVWESREELAGELGLGEDDRARLLAAPAPSRMAPDVAPGSIDGAAAAPSWLEDGSTGRPVPTVTLPRATTDGDGGVQRVIAPVPAHVIMDRTITTPVTTAETAAGAVHVQRAHVPLHAWQQLVVRPRRATNPLPASRVRQAVTSRTVSASSEPGPRSLSQEPAPPWIQLSEEVTVDDARQQRRDAAYEKGLWRSLSAPRRITDRDTLIAMKTRIPSPEELRYVQEAQNRAAVAAQVSVPSKKIGGMTEQEARDLLKTGEVRYFSELQQTFLTAHGHEIRQEMPGVKLTPAPVAAHVQNRFISSAPSNTILPAYHGTREQNHPGILSQGLRIPGHGGVTVANGSAHGVGIYTAKLGNSWLSKGFSDCDKFFVCAVADGPAQKKSGPSSGSSQPVQSGVRFHRNHQKPSVTSSRAPTFMGNHQVHQESTFVRHVGGAMVVFDESRVTPLFVADGIGKTFCGSHTNSVRGYPQSRVMPNTLAGTNLPNRATMHGGGVRIGTHQAKVGNETLWLPAEAENYRQATLVRRRMEAKARDVDRRAQREAKGTFPVGAD